LAWWCATGALIVVSATLFRLEISILIAANPTSRLPWIGRPANAPRSAKVLQFFALLPLVLTFDCVSAALGRRQVYDGLWGLPLWLIALAFMMVAQAQHNRRVQGAA
jgi:hypothetical protein